MKLNNPKRAPILATVTAEGAYDVAVYLDSVIDKCCPMPMAPRWREVIDALYAIANDTDAIVTDVEDLEES